MQIQLIAVGSYGDILPILALGAELMRRGHETILAAPAPFEPLARRAGVPFHSLGTQADYDRLMGTPDLWHPRRGIRTLLAAMAGLTEQSYAWLARRRLPRDTLVIASSLSLGARIAQETLGFTVITVHSVPLMVESRTASPLLPGLGPLAMAPSAVRHWLGRGADRYVLGPAVLPQLNAFRARLNLDPVQRLRHWWNSPSGVLLLFPDWFAAPQADWLPQALQTGFPIVDRLGDAHSLSPELSAFLTDGPPPLVFTYGSAMRQGRRFFETAIGLCRRMGRRGVFLAPQADQVPEALPDGMIYAAYAPLSELLPRSAALIHHGGIGTVAQAFAAGIPQLIVPVAFDHFDEGRRVRRLGLGESLGWRGFTPARAQRHLERLLASPAVAARCRDVRARMAQEDGVSRACDQIQDFIGF